MIELESVSFRRGAALVLDHVTLGLGDGVVALVGPSGSGKSSTARTWRGAALGASVSAPKVITSQVRLRCTPVARSCFAAPHMR